MSLPELCLAILLLLVTPGPTNTLLFLAGTERGAVRALSLIPAEVAGYLAAVLPLMLFGAVLMARVTLAEAGTTILAAIWVAVLAVRLARLPVAERNTTVVTARQVFVTTLLNPKALIFGLVLLPGPMAVTNLALFVTLVMSVAACWATAGATLHKRDGTALVWFRRMAAVWLAAMSAALMVRGLGV